MTHGEEGGPRHTRGGSTGRCQVCVYLFGENDWNLKCPKLVTKINSDRWGLTWQEVGLTSAVSTKLLRARVGDKCPRQG